MDKPLPVILGECHAENIETLITRVLGRERQASVAAIAAGRVISGGKVVTQGASVTGPDQAPLK